MKNNFFYWFKTYLGFSRKESTGFVLLIPILALLGFLPSLVELFKNKRAEAILEAYEGQLDSLRISGIKLVSSPLPTFNPNDTVNPSRSQKKIESLNRIFFSEADSITLQIVPGIGPATAGRIIKYRESLGGYYNQSQLLEIYGMKEETMEAIWEYFEFDPKVLRKMKINSLNPEELAAHPYISYGEAKVLFAFRNQHGPFGSSDDLLKIKIFKPEWISKIKPYLDFE